MRAVSPIPGICMVGATTIAAIVTDPKAFKSGRGLAGWTALVPRQDSTGSTPACAVFDAPRWYPWLTTPLARRPFKVVAAALANKTARIAWVLRAKGGTYRPPQLAATV
jgi:transposase